ncbi:hypothetical protein LguiB_001348 [Lonicera macranthoides]
MLDILKSGRNRDFVLPDIPPHQQVVPPPPPPEVVLFEEPHGDSPDTMQPQEQVPGGYSPVQPQEPGGYSPKTYLGASFHENSLNSSQPPPYASPSHQAPSRQTSAGSDHPFKATQPLFFPHTSLALTDGDHSTTIFSRSYE